MKSFQRVLNQNVEAYGNVDIYDTSYVVGNVTANGNVNVGSSANPNIDGDVIAGSNIAGGGNITGTQTELAGLPVPDRCTGAELAKIAVTKEVIDELKATAVGAGTYFGGSETFDNTTIGPGVIFVKDNVTLMRTVTVDGDTTLVAELGNFTLDGSSGDITVSNSEVDGHLTILVYAGNFEVLNTATMNLNNASVQVGGVNEDGTNLQGGNLIIQDDAELTVNGGLATLNGDIQASSGATFVVNHIGNGDSNLSNPDFDIENWREVRTE